MLANGPNINIACYGNYPVVQSSQQHAGGQQDSSRRPGHYRSPQLPVPATDNENQEGCPKLRHHEYVFHRSSFDARPPDLQEGIAPALPPSTPHKPFNKEQPTTLPKPPHRLDKLPAIANVLRRSIDLSNLQLPAIQGAYPELSE